MNRPELAVLQASADGSALVADTGADAHVAADKAVAHTRAGQNIHSSTGSAGGKLRSEGGNATPPRSSSDDLGSASRGRGRAVPEREKRITAPMNVPEARRMHVRRVTGTL